MTTAPPATAGDREAWLLAAGPRALLRQVRTGKGSVVLALSIRPGTLTNTVSAITLRFTAPGAADVLHDLPVFPLYARQWAIDVTAGLASAAFAAAGRWQCEVVLQDASGTTAVPVRAAEREAFSLGGLPDLDALVSDWAFVPGED